MLNLVMLFALLLPMISLFFEHDRINKFIYIHGSGQESANQHFQNCSGEAKNFIFFKPLDLNNFFYTESWLSSKSYIYAI